MWLLILLMLTLADIIKTADYPCYAVKKEAGFVCLCNATHCDTIDPPTKLGRRQFHIYSTSNKVPGFNHRIGNFRMQAFAPHGIKIEINDERKRQSVLGIGGAFSDSFGYVVDKLSNGSQNNLLRSYFSTQGIEYTFCRVVLGSSDFSLRHYSYVPNYDPSLKSFNLTEDDYKYKISVIQKAIAMSNRKINLMGCTWSAPPWMKRTRKIGTSYLLPKLYQTWAEYHVKIFDTFKENGIEFWGLTAGNEPITLIGLKAVAVENMVMLPEQQRDWIAENLGPSLEKAGYVNKSIIVLDDMRRYAEWWMETVMRSDIARKYISGIGLHWYSDSVTSPQVLDKLHERYLDKDIVYTETSINPAITLLLQFENNTIPVNASLHFQPVRPLLGSWKRAMLYISNIMENLKHWVTGYMDWNMALNAEGGPNNINLTCDAPIIVNNDADEFYKQPMFYALGHFSKFLQPGAIILDLDDTSTYVGNDEPYRRKQSERVEPKTTQKPPHFELPAFFLYYKKVEYIAALNPDGTHTVIIFNPTSLPVEISVHDKTKGYAFFTLEPESLNTVIY